MVYGPHKADIQGVVTRQFIQDVVTIQFIQGIVTFLPYPKEIILPTAEGILLRPHPAPSNVQESMAHSELRRKCLTRT